MSNLPFRAWGSTPIPKRVAWRAIKRAVTDPETGCHLSRYSVASHGYAQIGWGYGRERAMTTAHRAAWAAVNGQVPEGMTVDHLCKNRRCVNPEHLRLLSNHENARRTSGRDWPIGECANGHGNEHLVRVGKAKKQICRICRRQWQRDYRKGLRDAEIG